MRLHCFGYRREFPSTSHFGVMIGVQTGTLSFQLYGERVYFCFPPTTLTPEPAVLSHPAIPEHTMSHTAASEIEVLDRDGRPHMRLISSFDLATHCSASLGGISAHAREVVDTKAAFHDSPSLSPLSLLLIHMR